MKCLAGVLLAAVLAGCSYPSDRDVKEHISRTFALGTEADLSCQKPTDNTFSVRVCVERMSKRSFVCRVEENFHDGIVRGCVEVQR